MPACKSIRLLFKLAPLNAWRYALMERHLLRCPACRETAAGIEEVRAVPLPGDGVGEVADLWPAVSARLSRVPEQELRLRPAWRWAWAAAGFLAVLAAVLVTVSDREEGVPGKVAFSVRDPKLYGQPAQAIIFQTQDGEKTFVWVEKQ